MPLETSGMSAGVQVKSAAQLDSFLSQVRRQREQLLDLSADVQLQVGGCWCNRPVDCR
jgi:hypothetical protein